MLRQKLMVSRKARTRAERWQANRHSRCDESAVQPQFSPEAVSLPPYSPLKARFRRTRGFMLTAAVLSLVLAAAAQQTTPPETDGPVSTQSTTPRIPPAPPVDPNNLPIPAGAPSDDFGLVAWCHGALRGHMELAAQINEVDQDQEAIGREYLKSYEAALTAAPQSRTADGARTAQAARETGYNSWASARTSQNRETQKFTYLGWQLPGRCEHATRRLGGGADLLGAAIARPSAEPPLPTGNPQTTP
jgi:hypothetical protein